MTLNTDLALSESVCMDLSLCVRAGVCVCKVVGWLGVCICVCVYMCMFIYRPRYICVIITDYGRSSAILEKESEKKKNKKVSQAKALVLVSQSRLNGLIN